MWDLSFRERPNYGYPVATTPQDYASTVIRLLLGCHRSGRLPIRNQTRMLFAQMLGQSMTVPCGPIIPVPPPLLAPDAVYDPVIHPRVIRFASRSH